MLTATPSFAEKNPQRDVYFGEQHVHTSWSLDAYAFGNTMAGPADFYKYALGETITTPGGVQQTLKKPLDWGATTEHAEYMGMYQEALNPDSPLVKSSPWLSKILKTGSEADPLLSYKVLAATLAKGYPIKAMTDPAVLAPVWKRVVDIADQYYQPGKFTTFAAYEWTSTPDTKNLHRNIFFLDSKKVPEVPFSSISSTDPRDLWSWMDQQRAAGNELLAVSHNSNLSNGNMFPIEVDLQGKPIDAAYAEARLRNEPLAELKQVKGQSETTPRLSPNDEFANYEVFVWHLLGATGDIKEYGSYLRQTLKDGLAMNDGRGFNPYKFGFVSGSDSHSTAVPYTQADYQGVHGIYDDNIEKRINGEAPMGLNNLWVTPAGLSAVWAQENTREEIFAGMQRKETYSTSGVRIKARLFGSWEFSPELLKQEDWVKGAYDEGVPMGMELPATAAAKAPSFIVWALKDPDAANLDRIQIIKGWSKNGQSFEKVYDVSWAGERQIDPASGKLPSVGNTVDLMTATYTNSIGTSELLTQWSDPDFDPALDAFYFARVLEIPTPRWSTIQAVKLGQVPPSGEGFQPVIQERAWTSPIWYSASAEARKAGKPGLTLAQLQQQGSALDEAQLKDLLVGKGVKVTNTVTGEQFEILYGENGQRMITGKDGQSLEQPQANDAPYEIKDGKLSTVYAGTPFSVSVYHVGGQYLAARDNEFGFVNYVVESIAQ